MGPTRGPVGPSGPHVDPMNLATRVRIQHNMLFAVKYPNDIFKNALNLIRGGVLHNSTIYRAPLKLHTKCPTHTSQNMIFFIQSRTFNSSCIFSNIYTYLWNRHLILALNGMTSLHWWRSPITNGSLYTHYYIGGGIGQTEQQAYETPDRKDWFKLNYG